MRRLVEILFVEPIVRDQTLKILGRRLNQKIAVVSYKNHKFDHCVLILCILELQGIQ